MYRKIVNRSRLYIANGYIHKIIDNQHIVFADIENKKRLMQIESVEALDSKVFNIFQYQHYEDQVNSRTNANCGNNLQANYFDNQPNCRNDRRIYVRGYTYYLISGYNYTPRVIAEAWGELRTGTFCNWKSYKTRLSTRNCSFTVTATLNNTNYSFSLTSAQLPDYYGTTDEYSHIIWDGAVSANPIYWQGGTVPTIQFTQIHLEANSRGTGDNWVVLDCH